MECIRCGNCCRERHIDVGWDDLQRWRDQSRWDILREISFVKGTGFNRFFIEKSLKKADDRSRHCPFLTKDNLCSIQETKPIACAEAPRGNSEFKECPVFEKFPDEVILKTITRQKDDLMNSLRHFNEVMAIITIARRGPWDQ